MLPLMVHNQVDAALAAKGGHDRFCDRMETLAVSQGAELDDIDKQRLAELGESYVRDTLRLLESCATAAGMARVEALLDPLIGASVRFFLDPLPRGLGDDGLFGLVCDAYAARQLLSFASERMRITRGFPMLGADPHGEVATVRAMIGPERAGKIDDLVAEMLNGPQIRTALTNGFALQGSLRASARVSDWDRGWDEEVARFGRAIGMRFSEAA